MVAFLSVTHGILQPWLEAWCKHIITGRLWALVADSVVHARTATATTTRKETFPIEPKVLGRAFHLSAKALALCDAFH